MAIQLTIGIAFGAGIASGIIGYRYYLRRLYVLQKKIHKIQRGGR